MKKVKIKNCKKIPDDSKPVRLKEVKMKKTR